MKHLNGLLKLFGFFPVRLFETLRELPVYLLNLLKYIKQGGKCSRLQPVFGDRYSGSGTASGAYFHQDLLVARLIYERNPQKHVDVGSRVDGFVAHVASFREIEVIDIRPQTKVKGITFLKHDMTKTPELVGYCDSVSCLHALEHFGLGRYGDPVDVNGHLKGYSNLIAMLKPGGFLYLSFPMGKSRVEFDAHRIFSWQDFEIMNDGKAELRRYWSVDSAGNLQEDPEAMNEVTGIFELQI